MNSSGIKRGLAVSAVAAIAAVGLPLAANANTVNEQVGQCRITQYSFPDAAIVTGSVKNDGTDTTVTLSAGAGSEINQVTFQYRISAGPGAWQNIATTSRNDDGAFKHDWTVPNAIIDVPIDTRVIGDTTDPADPGCAAPGVTTQSSPLESGVVIKAASNPGFEAIAINEGSQTGVFQSPYGGGQWWLGISGTTSAAPGTLVQAGWANGAGNVPAFFNGTVLAGGIWEDAVDIAGSGYVFDNTAPIDDEIVVIAAIDGSAGGTDFTSDAEGFKLYKQVITTIEAQPTSGSIPDGGGTKPVVLTVKDQNGKPIAGARIAIGNAVQGTTNGMGQLTVNQGAGTVTYHVDATATPGFQAGVGDKSVSVTFNPYVAAPADLRGASDDGAAFDRDEYAADDITVQVLDSQNQPFDTTGQSLRYRWRITPFDGSPVTTTPAADIAAEVNGEFTVPLPAVPAGGAQFELLAQLLGDGGGNGAIAEKNVLTVKSGESSVVFEGTEPQWADVNTTATINGTLQLADGTALPNRDLVVSWTRGNAADGDDPSPDTTLQSSPNQTTNAQGKFSVQVRDIPDGPENSELGGFLTVDGAPGGTTPPPANSPDGANTDLDDTHGVDFVTSAVPGDATLAIDNNECVVVPGLGEEFQDTCDFFQESFDPGNLQQVDVFLTAADGVTPLKGRKVTLTVDKGFFVNQNGTLSDYDPTPVDNAFFPEYRSAGTTITVATGSNGRATAFVNLERDPGLDDDGKSTSTVTGTAGTRSDNAPFNWDTVNGQGMNDAWNISAVNVELTPGQAEQPVTTGTPVRFDVFAKDQYGNLVKDVNVTVGCAVSGGDDDPCPTIASPGGVVGNAFNSDYDNGGDFVVTSNVPGTFNFEAVASYNNTRWQQVFPGFFFPVTLTENIESNTFSASWYRVNLDEATFTITQDPANPVPVDTPVTVDVTALDQEGNPIPGLIVEFVRTSDANQISFPTDSNGVASYVFQGTQAQCDTSDTVTAVVRDPNDNGAIVEQLNVTVQFECEGQEIQVGLTGRNSDNRKRDILEVDATTVGSTLPVTGATVDMFKLVDGQWVQVGNEDRVLDTDGHATFKIRDRNGRGKTTYKAVVGGTDTTLPGESQEYTRR